MGYTTYEFYKEEYHGKTIDESVFCEWESRAKRKVDYFTFNRITKERLSDERLNERVQLATCAVADLLFKINEAEQRQGITETGEGKIIKSRSAGSESITYDTGNDIYTKVLTDTAAQKKLTRDILAEHLGDTGLMYCGVS
ncbi:MAG: hypothetical protein HFI34_06790 [Lachnospiraceae bacterium]|nr:hypothetical protein [Lachnospiraceae bacterium]